jgi:hypothetical protein
VRTRQGSYVRVVAVPGGGRQKRGDAYTPDHNARVVLSGWGTFTPAPDPSDALNELVAAAVADFLAQNEADWEKAVSMVEEATRALRACAPVLTLGEPFAALFIS